MEHIEADPEAVKKGLEIGTESLRAFVRECVRVGVDGFYASIQGRSARRAFRLAAVDPIPVLSRRLGGFVTVATCRPVRLARHYRYGRSFEQACPLVSALGRQAGSMVGEQVVGPIVVLSGPHEQVPGARAGRLWYNGTMTEPPSKRQNREASTARSQIPLDWLEEFAAAARRPLATRMKYAFIRTYKPVLDDEPFRAFDTMADYRQWCEDNLPDWLGYGRV